MRLIGFVLTAFALTPLAGADDLDMDAVVKSIRQGLAEQLTVSVQKVECPEAREIEEGGVFDCTARVEDVGRLTVAVTQKDDEGNIAWKVTKTAGLLDLASLEKQIHDGLAAHSEGAEVKVSCGGRYRGIQVGKTFECRAEDSTGEKVRIKVLIEDADGNVHWSVVQDSPSS
ncbi:MAG: hypothetical protein DMF78_01500 [Acidobacteria bacterium]|nr:MAG: hypothetical protein DMF78_01500 [Acidobacteriota bacterium]